MVEYMSPISARTLKTYLHDGEEIALLDAREEVPFDKRHILMASCVPLGRLETIIDASVPRRSARVVWCDDGEGLAERAAARMAALGYTNVTFLDGGIGAWEAEGYRIYQGVHVPSKAFAEVIEHEAGTPYISAKQLKELMDSGTDYVLLDSRSYEEYHGNSIPTAVSVPGAELVYRFNDLVPSPETTVVVNCGGRTRSIIGAQSLIDAGYPNKIVSLMNGTQGWHLAGYEIVVGATATAPDTSEAATAAAKDAATRVARRFDIQTIDLNTLGQWQAETDTRSLYVLDVRTRPEYEAGHLPGVKHIMGGQLIQETDRHLATWGARVVLIDDVGVRATMTASWLKRMGWDAAVLPMENLGTPLESGPYVPKTLGLDAADVPLIPVQELKSLIDDGNVAVIDVNWSKGFHGGHIPGSWFMIRSRLADDIAAVPAAATIVTTSPDGALARLAAAEIASLRNVPVKALAGGTDAWRDAGLPLEAGNDRMASAVEDIRLKAREESENIEEAMNRYLAWEIALVDDMANDDDQRFNIAKS